MSRFRLPIWIVAPALLLVLLFGFGAGYLVNARTSTATCTESKQVCENFGVFWRAWNIVQDNYVDPKAIDPQKMTDGAVEGMLDSLGDQGHTRYLSPDVAQAERESLSGKFEGIGAYIDVRDEQPIIVRPIEGSPAERAGIKPGDAILKVDGVDVHGITVEELRNKVRGPEGSKVKLTLRHEGEQLPYDVEVERAEISVPSVSWRMLPDNIAMIQLTQFSAPSSDEMEQALKDAKQQGAKGIILDLRNNPGGLVNELVDIASLFMPPGTTVLLEQNRAGERTPYKTSDSAFTTDLPLVVLVNHNSASSAEILAASLKENDRATVIGVPTFGTATVLRSFPLGDGAELRLGTTQWLTPQGEIVRGIGIEPNKLVDLPPQVVPLSPADASELNAQQLQTSDDEQLAEAFQQVKAKVANQAAAQK